MEEWRNGGYPGTLLYIGLPRLQSTFIEYANICGPGLIQRFVYRKPL